MFSKLTIKRLERRHWRFSTSIANLEQVITGWVQCIFQKLSNTYRGFKRN